MAPVLLMLTITITCSKEVVMFQNAVKLAIESLLATTAVYKDFLSEQGIKPKAMTRLFSIREFNAKAEPQLRDLISQYPHPDSPDHLGQLLAQPQAQGQGSGTQPATGLRAPRGTSAPEALPSFGTGTASSSLKPFWTATATT